MKDANENRRQPEDTGTMLEPIESLRSLYGHQTATQSSYPGVPSAAIGQTAPVASTQRPQARVDPGPSLAAQPAAPVQPGSPRAVAVAASLEEPFRPTVRPPTPRLTLLDDGESAVGEVLRLRDQVTQIGRTEGHVRLPHDLLVSSKHAEIVREGTGTAARWILRDLGSSNGTFVCCAKTVLRPDRLIILGSRRYRFQLPQPAAKQQSKSVPSTMMLDAAPMLDQIWPALIETSQSDSQSQIILAGMELTLGRRGFGNRIELDDPLLASHHATIRRSASGDWSIEAKPSRNGIWAQINALRLSEMCRFQCGEQRFLFVV